jgi:hypothetical protein
MLWRERCQGYAPKPRTELWKCEREEIILKGVLNGNLWYGQQKCNGGRKYGNRFWVQEVQMNVGQYNLIVNISK